MLISGDMLAENFHQHRVWPVTPLADPVTDREFALQVFGIARPTPGCCRRTACRSVALRRVSKALRRTMKTA